MPEVTFQCFLSESGRDVIDEWYRGQSAKVRARFVDMVTALAERPRSEWNRPEYGVLKMDGAGLGEIRFKADSVQQRPLGFFADTKTFVILLCATEKGGKFVPKNACDTAQKRKKIVETDRRRARDCDF